MGCPIRFKFLRGLSHGVYITPLKKLHQVYTLYKLSMYTSVCDPLPVGEKKRTRNFMAIKRKDQTNPSVPEAQFVTRGALNITESAIYCGVRCAAIESAVRDGKLRGRRLGRNIIILKADLDAFLASLDVIPVHTPPSILRRRQERSQQRTTTAATYLNERTVNAND